MEKSLFENLRMLPHAPGVQIQTIPEDAINDESDDEVKADNEFSDSEDEGEGGRRDNRSYKGQRKRPRLDKDGGKATESSESKDDKDKMDTTESEEPVKSEDGKKENNI